MKRRPPTHTDDAPSGVPAVIPRADWSDWSQQREQRRLQHNIEERQKAVERAIYPREIAAKIADDAAKTIVPDWRLLRSEQGGLFGRLLRDQPELQQREVRQFDKLLTLIADNLPRHLAPLLADVRTILELRLLAHETAAFLVGTETGRRLERQYVDRGGRLRSHQKAEPPAIDAPEIVCGELRLHLAD